MMLAVLVYDRLRLAAAKRRVRRALLARDKSVEAVARANLSVGLILRQIETRGRR